MYWAQHPVYVIANRINARQVHWLNFYWCDVVLPSSVPSRCRRVPGRASLHQRSLPKCSGLVLLPVWARFQSVINWRPVWWYGFCVSQFLHQEHCFNQVRTMTTYKAIVQQKDQGPCCFNLTNPMGFPWRLWNNMSEWIWVSEIAKQILVST